MNNKIVKDIIEFTLQNCVDWQSEICLDCIEDLLTEKINVVICGMNVLAVVQCNDQNNQHDVQSDGRLVVDVLLVNAGDLTTDRFRACSETDMNVVTVSFEEQW